MERKITAGCSDKSVVFCPDQPATRGQVAVFLVRMAVGDTFTYQETPYFDDVPANH